MQRWLSPLLSHWSTPLGVPPGSLQRALMALAVALRIFAGGLTGLLIYFVAQRSLGTNFLFNGGFMLYGWDKLFGGDQLFFIDANSFRNLGIPLPELNHTFVGLLELFGGLALLLGLFTRVFGFLLAGNMLVAMLTAKDYTSEFPLFAACLLLVWIGGGFFSLDQALDRRMAGMKNPTSVVSRL